MLKVVDKKGLAVDLVETYIEFSDEFNPVTIGDLINKIESAEGANYVRLYFSSPGGMASSLMMLYDYFKNTDKVFQINVTGLAASAGIFILLMIREFDNVSIYWDLTSAAMLHMVDLDYSHRDLANKRSLSSFMKKYTKDISNELDKYAEEILTEDEKEDYHSGLDIYIDRARLNKFFERDEETYVSKITNFMMSEGTVINLPEADFTGDEEEEETKENTRGFEIVKDEFRKHPLIEIIEPQRATKNSAGYDFYCPSEIAIVPNGTATIFTDVKAYMQEDEKLSIHLRSSAGIKKGLRLLNGTGIIDADYYFEKTTGGNIIISIKNTSASEVIIKSGEKIAQGIFEKFLTADGDNVTEERTGGIGSTGSM